MSNASRYGTVKTLTRDGLEETPSYSKVHKGLVVIRPAGAEDGEYCIIHVASGLSITEGRRWKRVHDAREALKKLAEVADWTLPAEQLRTRAIGEQVRHIVVATGAT